MNRRPFFQVALTAGITFAFSFLLAMVVFAGMGFGGGKGPFSKGFSAPQAGAAEGELPRIQPESPVPLPAYEMTVANPPLFRGDRERLTQDEQNTIEIYNHLNAAVVNITTEILAYNFFLDAIPQSGVSGSGSVIDASGIILTNTHVVDKAYKVYVNFSDGSQYEGKVVGKDPENDLAVIQIDPKGKPLTVIPFGSSDDLMIGQKVLAIGNPFGYDRTLTTGIVSGLARPVQSSGKSIIQNMIQTDAPINPGNSGGPLINSAGQMIGINTMIYSPTGASVGIGFAVPVNTAKRVLPDLLKYGSVKRGWLDLTSIQLTDSIARQIRLPVSRGLLVSEVRKKGFCERAGIRGGTTPARYGRSIVFLGGDIITHIDGQVVKGVADMLSALEDNKPGEVVPVGILRNGEAFVLQVELDERRYESDDR